MGVWIEIVRCPVLVAYKVVTPCVGVWIEIALSMPWSILWK